VALITAAAKREREFSSKLELLEQGIAEFPASVTLKEALQKTRNIQKISKGTSGLSIDRKVLELKAALKASSGDAALKAKYLKAVVKQADAEVNPARRYQRYQQLLKQHPKEKAIASRERRCKLVATLWRECSGARGEEKVRRLEAAVDRYIRIPAVISCINPCC